MYKMPHAVEVAIVRLLHFKATEREKNIFLNGFRAQEFCQMDII